MDLAAAMNDYAPADRGTWVSFKNRGGLAVLAECDKRLYNRLRRDRRQPGPAPAREAGAGAELCWLGGVCG